MSDVIRLVVKRRVVFCPQDDVISAGLTVCFVPEKSVSWPPGLDIIGEKMTNGLIVCAEESITD